MTFTPFRNKIRHVANRGSPFAVLGLVLLLSSAFTATPVVASPADAMWSSVHIPTEGTTGKWVLAKGADIRRLTMAGDGTLYCHANPVGTSHTLFKSTDGGYNWSYTGGVEANIIDIATAPDNADVVYYATSSNIHKSTDAGNSFTLLAQNPGGAGSNNIEITSIDVTSSDSGNIIAVGTRDTDNSQYGGIYTLDESESLTWIDSNLGNYDVYAVAFSPSLATDRQLVAIVTNEADTTVTTKIGTAGWGETIGNATITGLVPVSAAIAFPGDYDSEATSGHYVHFVAVDTVNENGDVYQINGNAAPVNSAVTDLDIGSAYGLSSVDIAALSITGNTADANLMAGTAGNTQIYLSTDGGNNWIRSTKTPTGQSKTCVLMAPDFINSGKAYAATNGSESAFSITQDGGITWNQIGLIDTGISDIIELAPSPSYSIDNTLFMLTFGSEHSLWRSLNSGTRWERIYSSALPNVDWIDLIELSPQYNSSGAVFIAGGSSGNPAIWKSTDNGQSFDQPKLSPFPIDVWAVANDNTLFVGSFDDINHRGLVYCTTDSGSSYSTPAVAGSQSLSSIALSPNYDEDGAILVGKPNRYPAPQVASLSQLTPL